MGGTNTKDNLIDLTAREHFLAHWLLWRIYRNRKMSCAFMFMCRKCSSARGYEEARKSLKEVRMTSETRKRISDSAKKKVGEKNGFFGKTHTQVRKNEWSLNRKGKISPKRKSIEQFNIIDGKTIKVFSSLQEASIELKMSIATISFACNNTGKKVRKGRTFNFKYINI